MEDTRFCGREEQKPDKEPEKGDENVRIITHQERYQGNRGRNFKEVARHLGEDETGLMLSGAITSLVRTVSILLKGQK